jgi:hypothetical protein
MVENHGFSWSAPWRLLENYNHGASMENGLRALRASVQKMPENQGFSFLRFSPWRVPEQSLRGEITTLGLCGRASEAHGKRLGDGFRYGFGIWYGKTALVQGS